ncbi:MAG TPA: hypothetical protein ENK04_15635 [Gammaproteobacteria bacterium]|nr:hypothetical protein [Gammaproteobacteria bacterium]
MNFGARFSEFGMTGAVFWICQILLFTIGTGEAAGEQFLNMLSAFIGTEEQSPILKSAAGSLLTIFGLIGIFVTGLVLDMIGSIFFMQEMRIFGGHISRNTDWLSSMTKKCSVSVAKDYRDFQEEFGDKNISNKQKYVRLLDPRFHYRRFTLRPGYRHLQTFLLSYIHVYSANGASDQLTDHVHVWRTSRAISTALFIVAIEVIAFENFTHAADEIPHDSGPTTLIIYGTLFALSAMLTLKSYNRMCFSLFTLSCATNSHQISSK